MSWRWWLAPTLAGFVACGGAAVEPGVFFPTWDPNDAPDAIVQGELVRDEDCLFLDAHGVRTLVAWEEGMGFDDGSLLGRDGDAIARPGERIHGGGGYFDGRSHMEQLSGASIPARCIPEGDDDRFAIIYAVEAGLFE